MASDCLFWQLSKEKILKEMREINSTEAWDDDKYDNENDDKDGVPVVISRIEATRDCGA